MCYCHIMYKLSDSDWLENSTPPKKRMNELHTAGGTPIIFQLKRVLSRSLFHTVQLWASWGQSHVLGFIRFFILFAIFIITGISTWWDLQYKSIHYISTFICFIYYTSYSVSIYLSIKMVTIRLQHNYSCLPLTIFSVLKWEHRQLLNYPLGIKKYFV